MNSTADFTIPLGTKISLGFITVFAVLLNLLVCFIVYKNKPMRNYTNSFVVSLSFSDILMALVILSQYLVDLNSPMISNVLYAVAMFSGVANLCAVTFDRYIAVTDPLRYLNLMHRYFQKILLYVWVGSIAIALIPVSWGGYVRHDGHTVYVILTLVLCIFVPFVFIVFSHCCIFYHARRCSSRHPRLRVRNERVKRAGRVSRSEFKVARIFLLVALMFLLSWFPVIYYSTAIIFNSAYVVPSFLIDLSPFTLALGTLINPVIYSLMKPDFRIAIRKLFLCRPTGVRIYEERSTSLETTRSTLRNYMKSSDNTESENETCV